MYFVHMYIFLLNEKLSKLYKKISRKFNFAKDAGSK